MDESLLIGLISAGSTIFVGISALLLNRNAKAQEEEDIRRRDRQSESQQRLQEVAVLLEATQHDRDSFREERDALRRELANQRSELMAEIKSLRQQVALLHKNAKSS